MPINDRDFADVKDAAEDFLKIYAGKPDSPSGQSEEARLAEEHLRFVLETN